MQKKIKEVLDRIAASIRSFKPKDAAEAVKKAIAQLRTIDVRKFDFKKLHPKNIVGTVKSIKIDPAAVKKNYVWIILGVLIFTLLMAKTAGKIKEIVTGEKAKKGKEAVEFMETVPVKVYKVKLMDFKDTLPMLGRIEGFREIELRFDSKGIIESFNFEEGERILEGDIIASLDQKDALLKLKYSNLELEKAKKMFDLGGVSKLAVDQKQLEYESAKRDLEKTNIYAPSDGYLGSREKDPGTFVMSQDKIGMFVDYSRVYATFDVIEEDAPKVKVGQKGEVFLDAYPGESYAATIDMVSPMIEGRTRTQNVKAELENEEGKLKPGMFARAIINTYEKKDALIIPASAFKKKENQYFVYVVHPEEKQGEEALKEGETAEETSMKGTVEEREISIEYLTHDMAEVGKGLKEGELIIRELHQEFKDKDQVEITEVQESIV